MKYPCKLLFGFSIVLGLSGSAILTHAQQSAAPSLRPITGGVYWMEGGAAVNIGAVVGKDGVIVIDAKTNAAAGKQILTEIGKVTTLPVMTVILTDSDFDHTYGLAGFPHGLTIIAQENAKKDLEATAGTARPAPSCRQKRWTKRNRSPSTGSVWCFSTTNRRTPAAT